MSWTPMTKPTGRDRGHSPCTSTTADSTCGTRRCPACHCATAVLTYPPERGLYRQFCPVPLYSATEIVLLPGAIRAT